MLIQNKIGADIMMALDDVVSSQCPDRERVEEATHRTIRWLDRCIAAHSRPTEQNLFGIVQGGLHEDLRTLCLEAFAERDSLPGFAIGGLSGGESKDDFWRVVLQCADALPPGKPRYLMGVGYALDLVVCVALGVDMFDCVFPTRTARFGNALVREHPGSLSLKSIAYADDYRPIDENCGCRVCKNYTRAYIFRLAARETTGCHLISYHNIAFQMRLMRDMRAAIEADALPAFVQDFMATAHPDGEYPQWAVDALAAVDIALAPPSVQAADDDPNAGVADMNATST